MDPYKKLDPYQLLGPTRVVVFWIATAIIGILIIILNMDKNNYSSTGVNGSIKL